jgi:hypothetical protein
MRGQFFIIASIIMIYTIVLSLQSFYSFNDIRITKTEEIVELNYIPYIKDSLIKTATVSYYSSKGDCDKVKSDINSTEKFLEEEMIKNGIKLTTFYTTDCPSPRIYFNFTLRSQDFYSKMEFVDELYCDGVLCLKFDEGYGNVVHDSSDYDNNGVLGDGTCVPGSGTCPTWTNGRFGKALDFDGKNDYIQVPDSSSLDIPRNLTLEVWVKWNGPTNYHQGIIAKREGCADLGNYGLYIANDSDPQNKTRFEFNNGTSYNYKCWSMFDSNSMITPNVWTHIAAVLDTQSQTVKIYLNGIQDFSGSTNQVPAITNFKLMIGMNGGCPNQYLNGVIDSVRVYNRTLSKAEIQADMNKG